MTRTAALSVFLLTALLPGVGAAAVDAQASRYYEDALSRYEKKDLDGAIIQLKNALQIDKSMLPVQLLLGRTLLQNGEVAAAEVALNEALRLGVNRAEVVSLLGQAYLAQGKHTQIFDQPAMRLEGLPTNIRRGVLLLRASASADLGNSREALQAIDEARYLDPKMVDSWLAEVPVRIRSREYALARKAVEQSLVLAPQSAEAWNQKASLHHVAGQLGEALAAYDACLKLDPAHTEARVARAGLYVDLGRLADASGDVEELRKVSPKEPRAAYLRALLAERDNRLDDSRKALADVTALIDPVPVDFIRYRPQLLMLNGLAHFGLNENEKARSFLELFQRSQGTTPVAKLLAQIYLKEERSDKAIGVLENYLKAQPADGQAMSLLARAMMSQGQHGRATALIKQALQTRDAPEFRTVLGISLIQSGQMAGGVAELEAVWLKDPHQLQVGSLLAALYLQARQADKAVKVAEVLVKSQPASAAFHNLLGMAKSQAGDLAAAQAAFARAVQLDGKLSSPKLNLARIEIANQSFDTATQRLAAILRTDDRNSEAHFLMGVISERRGQLAEAERWMKKAADLSGPKEVRWLHELMEYQLRQQQPAAALEAAKAAASKLADDVPVLLTLARVQLINSASKDAVSTLTKATRLASFDPSVQVQIALLQMSAGNLHGAAYSLDKALSAQADFLPAQALMTEVELKQGEPAKAERRAREIIAKHPKRSVGHSLVGDIAATRGQSAAALDAYRKAHQTEPSSDTLLRLMGMQSKVGAGETALQLAEQWTKNHPKDIAVRQALADGYARANNFTGARQAYENVLKASPDNAVVLNNLANVLFKLNDPSAVKVAEQAVANSPGNPLAIDTLGWGLLQLGQTDRALQLLRDARLRAPDNLEIRYHLAAALAKTGRNAEAKEELKVVLDSTFDHAWKVDAGVLLRSIK